MKKEDRLDKAFQKAYEGFEPKVPSNSWDMVKKGIDEFKLSKIVSLKNRYRNLSAILGVLLVGFLGHNWFSNSLVETKQIHPIISEVIKLDTIVSIQEKILRDTIYLTRYVARPIDLKDILLSLENESMENELLSYLDAKKHTREEFEEVRLETKDEIVQQKPVLVTENELQNKPIILSEKINLNALKGIEFSLLQHNSPNWKISALPYRAQKIEEKKEMKVRIPLSERLFYQGLFSTTNGNLVVNGDKGLMAINHGFDVGLFAGVMLSDRLWLKTGLKYDLLEYSLNSNGRIEVNSEKINNEFKYVYRSPLGNLIIPNENLSSPATENSSIRIESHDDNTSRQLYLPIQLNYDIIKKHVKLFGYYRKLNVFAGASALLHIPLVNNVSLEIYETDGSEFELTIDRFSGVSNLSFGAGLQGGAKLEFYPGWKFMSEFGVRKDLTYYVNNEYYRSLTRGFSLSAGLEIDLK